MYTVRQVFGYLSEPIRRDTAPRGSTHLRSVLGEMWPSGGIFEIWYGLGYFSQPLNRAIRIFWATLCWTSEAGISHGEPLFS